MKKRLLSNIIKLIISIITLWAIWYKIYNNPKLINNKNIQDKIIEKTIEIEDDIDDLYFSWVLNE